MENINSRLNLTEIISINNTTNADCWKIVCVISGTLNVTLGGNVYKIESPGVVLCSPKDYYCITQNSNTHYILINCLINGELLKDSDSCAVNITERERLIAEQIDNLKDELSNTLKHQEFCILLELLILRCITKQPITAIDTDRDAVIFNNATEILKSNIKNQISVTELSEKLKVSLSHLKRIFAKYAKVGVHEYFTYLKITEAKRLLKAGETVTRTAEITGFANQAYFSSAFKRIIGVSPKEFSTDNIRAIPKQRKARQQNSKTRKLPDYLL